MKNLGKILILLTLLTNILNATVTASVDSQRVVKGEMVTLSLKLDGEDVKPPKLDTICGEDVISTNSQTSIEMINGSFRKNYVISYRFLPQVSCNIEPIAVEVGVKTEYTKSIDIDVVAQQITKNTKYILTIEASKDEVYVGESFELTLLFKQRNNANAVDSEFTPPNLHGFWVKEETKPVRYKDGDYTTTKVVYRVAAQREGVLNIAQAQMKIASRVNEKDTWGYLIPKVKWRTYFSNDLDIKVKRLPSGVELVGDFKIEAEVDKSEIDQNEAVNLSLKIVGDGNLEDIKTLKPEIDGVSIFDEKVEINANTLTQKIAFVSDSDFTIPSISLKYFDLKSKEIKSISTKEFHIKVKGSKAKKEETLNIKRQENEAEEKAKTSGYGLSVLWAVFIFIAGVIVGISIMLFRPVFDKEDKNTFDIKDEKMLLIKLLPYQNDIEVKELMNRLESNIYSDKKEPLNKKDLKNLLKRLGIS